MGPLATQESLDYLLQFNY